MSVGAILTLGLGEFGSVNLLPTLGYGGAVEEGVTGKRKRPRRKKPLFIVKFNEEPIAVDSPQEMVELARLSDSIPRITLSKTTDYGPMLNALKAAIKQLDEERQEAEEIEVISLLLH